VGHIVTDSASASESVPDKPAPGLLARVVGVLLSPKETYGAIAVWPRAFGALVVVLAIVVLAQGIFLSTEVGQQAALDQNVRAMEAFGVQIPDEAYQQMEEGMRLAPVTGGISATVFWPLLMAIVAGLFTAVFTMLMGGNATFKHVFAVVAHSCMVIALQQAFSMPLSYARGEFAGANLGIFAPMLEETSFPARFLGAIDLFFIWWMVNVSIGLAVLYKRRTGGIATTLLGIYAVIALGVAFWRSGS
jgi:hypothetical protein